MVNTIIFLVATNFCSVENKNCFDDLYPEDKVIMLEIKEEAERIKNRKNKSFPICPIGVHEYYNLECV